jgi:hypothetical protein
MCDASYYLTIPSFRTHNKRRHNRFQHLYNILILIKNIEQMTDKSLSHNFVSLLELLFDRLTFACPSGTLQQSYKEISLSVPRITWLCINLCVIITTVSLLSRNLSLPESSNIAPLPLISHYVYSKQIFAPLPPNYSERSVPFK